MNHVKLTVPFRTKPEVSQRNLLRLSVACALAAGAVTLAVSNVDARITKIQITSPATVAFGGFSFPGVGQYERIVGKAFGEISPTDPHNTIIVDLQLAPRNANGNVEYSFDFYILKPVDLSKGNHKVHYEPPNRGSKTYTGLNRVGAGNDPASLTDPAALSQAFLWTQGYTSVFSGWDYSAGTSTANFNTTITLPIAKNPDGSAITGPAYEYIVSPGASYALNYPAATLDQSKATLTHRVHLDDPPQVVSATDWAYNATGTAISLLPAGTSFIANDIYEFSYTAKDPTVNGVGFAAIRDFNSFLRYATADDFGTKNPLAGDVTRIYTEISSQPGRLLNDFRTFGFNADEKNRIVFDGMMQWISAGSGIGMNYRFSQPGRTERNRQDHLFAENVFPFANVTTTDPFTGKTAGRYDRCSLTSTCPLGMEIYSANEYWVKTASLLHTDPAGKVDLPDHPLARNYFISSHQHGTGNATNKGNCQQFQNPLNSAPIQRALWMAMDDWSTKGTLPPPSAVPRLDNGTLVPPLPQSGVGFPKIPGVTYTGLKTTRYLLNYGPNFYATGIPSVNPPVFSAPYQDNPANGPIYPSYVPKTDSDGNDIAGIRLPDVVVPLATYTGWALRSGAQANDGCESAGQYIPFPKTKADRIASGDPRLSVEERYGNVWQYYFYLVNAINDLASRRLMLPDDANRALNQGLQNVLTTGVLPKLGEFDTLE